MVEIRRLNTVRGLAALIVLVSHYTNATGWLGGYFGSGAGTIGVMLFFVLSGFLMAFLYLHAPFSRSAAYRFLVARVARVIPLYIVVVLFAFAAARTGMGDPFHLGSIKWLLIHLLFIDGRSVLWTIPPECHFYVLFTVFWMAWFQRPRIAAVIAIAVVVVIVAMPGDAVVELKIFDAKPDLMIFRSLPYFMVGLCLGALYRQRQNFGVGGHWCALALLAIPLLFPMVSESLLGWENAGWRDVRVLCAVAVIMALIIFGVPNGNRALENVVGDYLGKVSYSLYLLHIPVLRAMEPIIKAHPYIGFVGFLVAVLLVSEVSFRVVEAPARRYLRQWFRGQ